MRLDKLLNNFGLSLRNNRVFIKNSTKSLGLLQSYKKVSPNVTKLLLWDTQQNEPVTVFLRDDTKSVHIITSPMEAKHRVKIYGELLDKLLDTFKNYAVVISKQDDMYIGAMVDATGEIMVRTPLQPSVSAVVWWLYDFFEDELEGNEDEEDSE